jgi:2-keto-3-deoxy-6-phosphogluconate aldolase
MNTPSLIKQSKLLLAAAATICTLLPAAVLGGPAVLDSAINPANGHTYYLLSNSTWADAESAAIGLGGHLATIRSLAENNWIWNRWGTNRDLW